MPFAPLLMSLRLAQNLTAAMRRGTRGSISA